MRVGVICEGRTDFILLEQVVLSVFGPCEIDALQPMRDRLNASGWRSGGWTLVKKWCEERGAEGIADDMELGAMDALVVQVDGDLCGREGLPSGREALCDHIKRTWIGEGTLPRGVVICIPAMATDTWLVAALCSDPIPVDLEGDQAPVGRLGQWGLSKNQYHYGQHAERLRGRVSAIRGSLPELERFVGKLERVRELM